MPGKKKPVKGETGKKKLPAAKKRSSANKAPSPKKTKPREGKASDSEAAGEPNGEESRRPHGARFPIVGIGASAGGLEALQAFFSRVGDDTGIGFIVVTHMHPGHTSMLPQLLAKETAMPVHEAMAGQSIEPNHVYVATPGGSIGVDEGQITRIENEEHRVPFLAVDHLLRSLASDCREHAIGIVLSGTGSDGTLGVRAVKAESGMVMAQKPESAKYAGMPSSAIATGLVDYVLSAEEMPEQLVNYARGPYLQPRGRMAAEATIPNEILKRILMQLRKRTGHDFTSYKVNTVRRRIERRMSVHQLETPDDYLKYLQENAAEVDQLFSEMLISVTSFFRDPAAFDALGEAVTELLETRADDHRLRAWVPGCATGEEAYSVAITLFEAMEKAGKHLDVQVFGTDLDYQAIEVARHGVYADGVKADVSPERMARWFVSEDSAHRVRKELREMIVFAPQNVTKDPPFTKLDLIACRNVLIYMDAQLQKSLLSTFHYALRPSGLLFLGPSESLGGTSDLFEVVNSKHKVFRRKEVTTSVSPYLPADARKEKSKEEFAERPKADQKPKSPSTEVQVAKFLSKRFAPPSAVVNSEGEIVYIHGRTGLYLEPSPGQPRNNIVEMAREGLARKLSAALHKANSMGEAVQDPVRIKTNGNTVNVRLAVTKIDSPETLRGLLCVTFEPSASASAKRTSRKMDAVESDGAADLEFELNRARDELEKTVEQLETSNEELKSSNEELQSTNEELQSANEELETSKEELQSLNEELITVNAELTSKVEELDRANDDMHNLLNSTQIAIIFLDTNLKVRRYTDKAQGFIRLIQSDIGRHLKDLATNLNYGEFISDCAEVLRTLIPREVEVHTEEGSWQLVRIVPYRTTDNIIDGVVITMIDIGQVRDAQKGRLKRTLTHSVMESVLLTASQPMLLLDKEHRVVFANRAFGETFGVDREEVAGRSVFELGDGKWNFSDFHRLLERASREEDGVEDFRVECDFAGVGSKTFSVNGRRLRPDVEGPGETLLTFNEAKEQTR